MLFLYCFGVFVTKKSVRRLVLLYLGETNGVLFSEAVIVIIIVTLAYLTKKHRARTRLHLEVMVFSIARFTTSASRIPLKSQNVYNKIAFRHAESNFFLRFVKKHSLYIEFGKDFIGRQLKQVRFFGELLALGLKAWRKQKH